MANLDNLFMIMTVKKISASKLSHDTGISTGNISDWKSGRSMPTAHKLDILADYLGVSVDYLLGRTENPTEQRCLTDSEKNNKDDVSNGKVSSEDVEEITEMIKSLNLVQRSEIILMIDKMRKQEA